MGVTWIEIASARGAQSQRLDRGTVRVGGAGSQVELCEAEAGGLELGGDPARVVDRSPGGALRCNGVPVSKRVLEPGDVLTWRGVRLVARDGPPPEDPGQASLVELTDDTPVATERKAGYELVRGSAGRRMVAGVRAELGLAPRKLLQGWQEAVTAGRFEPDACAKEILESPLERSAAAQVEQRAARLMRDLLMAPVQRGLRGAGRSARHAARSTLARLVAQIVVLLLLAAMIFAAVLVARLRWGLSVDGILDALVGTPGG